MHSFKYWFGQCMAHNSHFAGRPSNIDTVGKCGLIIIFEWLSEKKNVTNLVETVIKPEQTVYSLLGFSVIECLFEVVNYMDHKLFENNQPNVDPFFCFFFVITSNFLNISENLYIFFTLSDILRKKYPHKYPKNEINWLNCKYLLTMQTTVILNETRFHTKNCTDLKSENMFNNRFSFFLILWHPLWSKFFL